MIGQELHSREFRCRDWARTSFSEVLLSRSDVIENTIVLDEF